MTFDTLFNTCFFHSQADLAAPAHGISQNMDEREKEIEGARYCNNRRRQKASQEQAFKEAEKKKEGIKVKGRCSAGK